MKRSFKKAKKSIFLLSIILGVIFLALPVCRLMAEDIQWDLVNLSKPPNPSRYTAAYFKIKIVEAWQTIIDLGPELAPVKIGILDTGINANHPEFRGETIDDTLVGVVDLGETPLTAREDDPVTEHHGTAVAGVIGANNLSFFMTLPPDSPQMNGIVSGVPSLSYTLEVRERGDLFKEMKHVYSL